MYTDGACSGNPGPGGWGVVLIYKDAQKELSGYESITTNNRMEIFAVIAGLQVLKESCKVSIYTDSAYVCNAFNQGWIMNWLRNGWKTAAKRDVENQDLWKELIQQIRRHDVKFFKVKGHADNPFNNRCDTLATAEIREKRNKN